MYITDTIAAVSTPRGKGGVALIRISGDKAVEIAQRIFVPRGGKPLSEAEPRRAIYGDIYSLEPGGGRRRIDDAVALVYRAPASFTGEDTVELTCHGGILITEAVLGAVLAAGARPAEAGEFTRRAFVAGKLGLTEAEALATLLEAKTHEQLLLSRSGMDGRLAGEVRALYDELLRLVSNIYALVDFPEEDLSGLSRDQLVAGVAEINRRLLSLAATFRTGKAIAEGVRTVICGRTNSGKSSLYNLIVGSDAAIVTDIEGTTRDLLETTVSFGGVTLRLFDTAGLRESEDEVEKIGIERARRESEGAELLFAVIDGSRAPDEDDRKFAEFISSIGAPVIAVINKSDLPESPHTRPTFSCAAEVSISALTGEGADKLADAVRRLFIDDAIDLSRDAVTMNARQFASLTRAAELTGQSLLALEAGLPEDVACSDLESAMSALAEVDGRSVSVDIVSEIFSNFCVGK